MPDDTDRVWKALADETRRAILDFLRPRPRTTTEVVEQFPQLSRFGVMKHMDVLRDAGLIITRDEGRKRINTLNAVPIRKIYERWVSKFEGAWADTLLRIQDELESGPGKHDPMPTTEARAPRAEEPGREAETIRTTRPRRSKQGDPE